MVALFYIGDPSSSSVGMKTKTDSVDEVDLHPPTADSLLASRGKVHHQHTYTFMF